MFSRKTDASKIALVALVERLRELDFELLDTQWMTPHLRQFGGYELTRAQYHKALRQALARKSPASEGPFPETGDPGSGT